MTNFYLIILVISTLAFIADLILRYMEKIKSFNFEKKLFKYKGNTIPLEKFLPENLTTLLFCIMIASAFGSLLNLLGLVWFLSLPTGIVSGWFACFIIQYLVKNAITTIKKEVLPKGEAAAGLDGYCTVPIEVGDWGKVILFYKDREFEVNAACALDKNEKACKIEEGIKVIAVYEKDGYYYVIRVDEIYKGIDTKF